MLVGGLDEVNQAATMLAFNVNSVAWVPMMGVGLAVSTMVGQQLGSTGRSGRAGHLDGLYPGNGLHVHHVVLLPDRARRVLMGHAAGMPAEQFQPLRDLIVVLLRFVAVYCLMDAMNVVFMSAIRGAGDTRFVLCTALGTSLVPLSLAWLGIYRLGQGVLWCWTLITLWVCSAGLIYLGRFLHGKWRTMRVINRRPWRSWWPSEDVSAEYPRSCFGQAGTAPRFTCFWEKSRKSPPASCRF